MKARLLSIVVSFLFTQFCFGQNREIIGTVYSGTGEPLSSAHVLDIDSRVAYSTDQFGMFHCSVPDSGTVLRVSHVGFRPVLFGLTQEMLAGSIQEPARIDIMLKQESTLLSTVTVSADDQIVIDSKRGIVLRDFNFSDGRNLLLMAENGIRHLVLCDDAWTEKSRIPVGKKGEALFEDCLGNTHLVGDDSVYQITVSEHGIELEHATGRAYFMEQMAHCATSSNSHIFFSSYQNAGQEVYHYGLERQSRKGIVLQHVYDHIALNDIREYFSDLPRQQRIGRRVHAAGLSFANEKLESMRFVANGQNSGPWRDDFPNQQSLDVTRVNRFRNSLRQSHGITSSGWYGGSVTSYFQSVSNQRIEQKMAFTPTWNPTPRDRGWLNLLSQPTYSPMFTLRDSVFVFDHVVGVCFVHDNEGNEVRSFPIEHQELKGWRNLLIADENGQRVYAHIKQRNKVFLMEVDLNNGDLIRSAQLPDAEYVEHLKVKDGYAYYLMEYSGVLTSDRMLRQKL